MHSKDREDLKVIAVILKHLKTENKRIITIIKLSESQTSNCIINILQKIHFNAEHWMLYAFPTQEKEPKFLSSSCPLSPPFLQMAYLSLLFFAYNLCACRRVFQQRKGSHLKRCYGKCSISSGPWHITQMCQHVFIRIWNSQSWQQS